MAVRLGIEAVVHLQPMEKPLHVVCGRLRRADHPVFSQPERAQQPWQQREITLEMRWDAV